MVYQFITEISTKSFLSEKPIHNHGEHNGKDILEIPGSRMWWSVEEADGHLLLDIGALQRVAELLEADHLVVVGVCLENGPLGDAGQLLFTGK